MSASKNPADKGFKPGANMPEGGYDPEHEGMADSGNHATGNPANDVVTGNQQQGRAPTRSDQNLRRGNESRTDLHNKQSASTASAEATHRDRSAGARGDKSSDSNN